MVQAQYLYYGPSRQGLQCIIELRSGVLPTNGVAASARPALLFSLLVGTVPALAGDFSFLLLL